MERWTMEERMEQERPEEAEQDMPEQAGQVPEQAGQVPEQAGQVPEQAGQVPEQPGTTRSQHQDRGGTPRLQRRQLLGAVGLGAAALAVPSGAAAVPTDGRAADPVRRWGTLPYLPRGRWGADESLRFDADGTELFPTAYFPVQTVTVHHTVTANDDTDPASTVRGIYAAHTSPPEDFGDLGYHLLIDERGRLYEGRYSGTDPLPVFGGGDEQGMSNGAHVAGFNAGNVGVALLGDLTATLPTAAARRSLVRVLAVLVAVSGLDPEGMTDYVNPISGDRATVPTLAGHRDWLPGGCPGDAFYPELPTVRREVAALLARSPDLRP